MTFQLRVFLIVLAGAALIALALAAFYHQSVATSVAHDAIQQGVFG